MQSSYYKIMQIYKIIFSLRTFFLTQLYFVWAWPKKACRMQTDRKTEGQTISWSYAKELANRNTYRQTD